MSSSKQVSSGSGDGTISQNDYNKMVAEIEAAEKNNEKYLQREQALLKQIENVEKDEYKQEQWIKDHDHWYDKVASWFTDAIHDHKSAEAADKAELKTLQGKLATPEKKINDAMEAQFAKPIEMLNLQVQKLFKEVSSSGGITQKLLEDVMQVMTEVMALVQMILSQTDNNKGNQETRISKVNVMQYSLANDNTRTQLNEYISALHTASILKIVSDVVKAVVCVAAIAIAAATGGACAVFVAVVIAALVMSGATDKLTEAIAKKLKEDGVSSGLAKVLSDVIVTAIMVVGTLGVGALSAIAEGVATEVISSVLEDVVSSVADDVASSVTDEVVEDVMETVGEDATQGVEDAATNAAKTVAREVGTTAGKAALRSAIRNVLRQSLVSTIRQVVTTSGREALSETVQSTVREAVESAVTDATESMTDAAFDAAAKTIAELPASAIESTTDSIAESAAESATDESDSAFSRVMSNAKDSVSWGKAAVNGLGTGIIGTNLLSDSLGAILQSIYGKDVKKKEWYQIVMSIVQVIQDILAVAMMAKFGGDFMNSSSEDGILAKLGKMDNLQKGASAAAALGEGAMGITQMIQGGITNKEADITRNLGQDKDAILIMNQLLEEMNQLVKDQSQHQGTELRDEIQNTLKTDNSLNQAAQAYANALESTAV
ncbi:hypothetical protein [Simkania sp.]|uniref:hypothetical protein n=1 Tax=Simkania sp. TaxID=34094 RepID=UPI003B52B832